MTRDIKICGEKCKIDFFNKMKSEGTLSHFDEQKKESQALWWMLVLAFLGGVFLNFMPCVLPLLSIKILSFSSKYESPLRAGIFYTAGMIFTFLTLGLTLSIFKASYGFQMQSPYFVFSLCLLFLGIGLHLFGFIKNPLEMISINLPQVKSQYLETFLNGIVTTVVATPCIGPYMGMVLGYALTQSVFYILFVFLFLGMGMASPILFFIMFSRLLKYVPKYSEKMEVIKKLSAFLCLVTVIWFLYILSGLISIETVFLLMALLLFMSFGAFFKITGIMIASLFGGFYFLYHGSQFNNREEINSLKNIQKPALLIFTAKWCFNCLHNKIILNQHKSILEKKGIHIIFIDVTKEFPPLFKKYKAPGVPFQVFIDRDGYEHILPEHLTKRGLEQLR